MLGLYYTMYYIVLYVRRFHSVSNGGNKDSPRLLSALGSMLQQLWMQKEEERSESLLGSPSLIVGGQERIFRLCEKVE